MTRVLVCGVGGLTGNAVLAAVIGRGMTATALIHRPSHRQEAINLGADDVVVADYNSADDIAAALSGIDAVYFISPVYQEKEPTWVHSFVNAAEHVGTARFIYHSVHHSYTPSMPHHLRKARSEVLIRSSGLRWTILQPAMYAQTAFRVRARSSAGTITVPYDPQARFAVVDVQDVAACAAEVISDDIHCFAGYEIAGPSMQTFEQLARAMNDVTGESRVIIQSDPQPGTLPATWSKEQRDEYTKMCQEYDRHGLPGSGFISAALLRRPATAFIDVARRELMAAPAAGDPR